jgi:hypothetical protein
MGDWYEPLRDRVSLGSTAKRPGSLAGLAQARREHMGQFFTPDALARYIWRIVSPAMERYAAANPTYAKVSVLDNSVGSGRLLQYADPDKHYIAGFDIDQGAVHSLEVAAKAAGFDYQFEGEGMENVRAKGFSVSLINPPFSLNLLSPNLKPYEECTAWGRFGPNTSANSHAYALAQALEAADVVVAVLPSTFAHAVVDGDQYTERLRAHFKVPRGAFREEGTEVGVDVLVFEKGAKGKFETIEVESLADTPPDLMLTIRSESRPRLKVIDREESEPAITMPVTGINTVRVCHDGRHVRLKFQCGLIQAKVLNAIYRERVFRMDNHRHPRGVKYQGQGVLDLEVHLAQDDPMHSFETLVATIANAAEASPDIDFGLIRHFKRRIRRSERQRMPLKHAVQLPFALSNTDTLMGKARKTHVTNPAVWGSPVIKAGQDVTFTKEAAGYSYVAGGKKFLVALDEIHKRFELDSAKSDNWVVAHEGLLPAYPQQAKMWGKRAEALGMHHWLNWKYQFDDAIELTMKPEGAIASWMMGLGKARLASALCLLPGCLRNLIVVEAYALPEMRTELEGLPISKDDWQIIESPEELTNLRKINVISLTRLRMPVDPARPKVTYAKRMRRRIGTMVVDEGHFMANRESDQTRACFAVCAKKRYVCSGTPCANYPRDILPLMTFTAGDGTAAQPYGTHYPYMEANHAKSMQYAVRGIEQFMNTFVELVWCTDEFAETLQDGAKREIPKISNLEAYRAMLAPHVLRRLDTEPEVTPYVKIPKPTETVVEVEWDEGHLAHYLRVADDFIEWYRNAKRGGDKKASSLVAILGKIGAVEMASNCPQRDGPMGSYKPLTSKQQAAVDWLWERTQEGHKSIMFAKHPGTLDLIGKELAKFGIECVICHGGIPVEKRAEALNKRFRFGPAPVLLTTIGVMQGAWNIWQATRVLMYGRNWSYKAEGQAIRRVCRPQQKHDVEVTYLQLPGSVDQYQQQMVQFKKDASHSGLDWATPETEGVEYLHLNTVLGRFVEEIAMLRGLMPHQLRESLKEETRQLELI